MAAVLYVTNHTVTIKIVQYVHHLSGYSNVLSSATVVLLIQSCMQLECREFAQKQRIEVYKNNLIHSY